MNNAEASQFLGLSANASIDEVRHRCEALLTWLRSDNIPEDLCPWASQHREAIESIYESLEVPQDPTRQDSVSERSIPRVTVQRRKQATASRSFVRQFLMGPIGLAAVGALLGLAVIGSLWWKGILFKGNEAPKPLATQADTFDPQQYLEEHQARLQELEQIVAATPNDAGALFELGETYMLSEVWDKAIMWFEKLLAVEPTNVHAWVDVGTASMDLGKYPEADAAFQRALALDPTSAQTHYNLGFLFAFRRDAPDLDKALEHWQEVIRLEPNGNLAKVAQVHINQFQPTGQ